MSGCQTDAVTGIHVAMTQHVPSSSWMTLGPWGCETPADQVYINMRVLPLARALAPHGEVSRLRHLLLSCLTASAEEAQRVCIQVCRHKVSLQLVAIPNLGKVVSTKDCLRHKALCSSSTSQGGCHERSLPTQTIQ